MRKLKDYLFVGLKGVGMGAADVIPGVSGGTIAFITGIYEELLGSIRSITLSTLMLIFKKNGFKNFFDAINAKFLISLVIGIAISFFSLAKLMQYLLQNHPVQIWSFFFGLILASVWYVGRTVPKWNFASVASFIAGIAVGFVVTVLTPTQTPDALWFIFICGAIAIIAMILPGISGSFILLLLGKYAFMMSALSTLNVVVLLVFICGAAIGIVAFSNVLSWLLKHFRSVTIALLTGFMLGSLNKVWPWKIAEQTFIDSHGAVKPLVERNVLPDTYQLANALDPHVLWAILLMVCGVALILVIEHVAAKGNTKVEPSADEFDREKLGF